MKIWVIEYVAFGGGTVHIARKTKEEALRWFFETYPYRNYISCYEQ